MLSCQPLLTGVVYGAGRAAHNQEECRYDLSYLRLDRHSLGTKKATRDGLLDTQASKRSLYLSLMLAPHELAGHTGTIKPRTIL